MAKTSKKNKPLREKLVEAASYNLEEALDILFEHKSEKFTAVSYTHLRAHET